MTEAERDQLRARVASGAATGEERDRLAVVLARAIRELDDAELDAIEALIDELRILATVGSDRTSCTDALAGALLDAQIRAFERCDAADAWRRLDEIRARLIEGGTPDLLHDRLAAALYNTFRGGELLANEPMRLAALAELRTRAFTDPSAAACRVALAELLADAVAHAARRDDQARAMSALDELERLHTCEPRGAALAREYARGLCEVLAAEFSAGGVQLDRLRALAASFDQASGDPIRVQLAIGLVTVHAQALRHDDELGAEVLRQELRGLDGTVCDAAAVDLDRDRDRDRSHLALMRELGKALHDASVLGLDADQVLNLSTATTLARSQRALAELRVLVEHHETDTELRGQLMSALFQVHRDAVERANDSVADRLQAEADVLLARDEVLNPDSDAAQASRAGLLGGRADNRARRLRLIRAELRLDHLRMLLASHARAGDIQDWPRARELLGRARALVGRDGAPLEMLELLGQMLVNAHVDAGSGPAGAGGSEASADQLLDQLRELAAARPHSGALQLHLGTALFNAHVDAGRRHAGAESEALLDGLERLHAAHPTLFELRRRLVMASVNHHGDALERGDVARADELLDRIRGLARGPETDDHLRVQLAMALGNSLAHVDEPLADNQGQRIISELRVLAGHEDASETLRALVLDELSDLFAPRQ